MQADGPSSPRALVQEATDHGLGVIADFTPESARREGIHELCRNHRPAPALPGGLLGHGIIGRWLSLPLQPGSGHPLKGSNGVYADARAAGSRFPVRVKGERRLGIARDLLGLRAKCRLDRRAGRVDATAQGQERCANNRGSAKRLARGPVREVSRQAPVDWTADPVGPPKSLLPRERLSTTAASQSVGLHQLMRCSTRKVKAALTITTRAASIATIREKFSRRSCSSRLFENFKACLRPQHRAPSAISAIRPGRHIGPLQTSLTGFRTRRLPSPLRGTTSVAASPFGRLPA